MKKEEETFKLSQSINQGLLFREKSHDARWY
jgi:hypothetical protein